MKKLEDAPKELQDMFAELWENMTILSTHKHEAAHLFLKGFDVAMATGGMRPKRKIADLFEHDGDLYAVSNDGQLYSVPCWIYGDKMTRPKQWHKWPDLPQD